MPQFEIGKLYHRRSELHEVYGGSAQSGISNCAKFPVIFLFTTPNGSKFGYKDGWIDGETYQYTGEGQVGNMELTRGNLAIRDHQKNGKELHLFQKNSHGLYEYIGRFNYQSHAIQNGPDADKSRRSIIVFKLTRI